MRQWQIRSTRFLQVKKRPQEEASADLASQRKFHSEHKLGTVEQMLASSPQVKVCVVTVVSSPNFPTFEPQTQRKLGDFIILTDPKFKRK